MQNKSIFLVNLIANVSENVIFAEVLEICCNKFDFYKLFCFRMRFILLLCFVGLALTRPQVSNVQLITKFYYLYFFLMKQNPNTLIQYM